MYHQYEQASIQQASSRLSWLWWPLTIILAGLLVYQAQMTLNIIGLYPPNAPISADWLTQTFIPGLSLGLAEWIALWLITRSPRHHWGIIGVTLASYLVTAPFTPDAHNLSNALIPFYSGHTARVMLLNAVMIGLLRWGTLALLQALFLPLMLRVRWQYALLWLLVGALAGMVAPAISVLTALSLHISSTDLLATLAAYSIYGFMTGLPLLWLIPHSMSRLDALRR